MRSMGHPSRSPFLVAPADFCGRYSGHDDVCVHQNNCSIRTLWTRLDHIVHESLSRTTLSDLLYDNIPQAAAPPHTATVVRFAADAIGAPSIS